MLFYVIWAFTHLNNCMKTTQLTKSLQNLPPVAAKRVAVRLSAPAERAVRQGHPWVFADSIASVSHAGGAGDVAIIFDKKRRFIAMGLYDPDSPIRIKLVHSGRPTPLDNAFWQRKLDAAAIYRAPIDRTQTTAYRCLHGENDGLPGLILDRYDKTLVLKLYTAAWFPHLAHLLPLIQAQHQPERIVLRLARRIGRTAFGWQDGLVLHGSVPTTPIMFYENGLLFEADVIRGQKTGHFLDQRDNRGRVRGLAQGKSVLDVFACTGGFSLYAAAGGATAVLSIDRSTFALDQAQRNFAHNYALPNVAACQHTVRVDDAFAALTQLAEQHQTFDVVVIDPPSFAQKQIDIPAALQAYRRLAKLGLQVTKSGGDLVLASCSSRVSAALFQETIEDAIGRAITITETTSHAADHPITFPEGAYLKSIFGVRGKDK